MNFPGIQQVPLSCRPVCGVALAPPENQSARVTASRKIKGSVRRNRMKRLLRESFRRLEMHLQPAMISSWWSRKSNYRLFPYPPEVRRLSQSDRPVGFLSWSVGAISPEEDRIPKDDWQTDDSRYGWYQRHISPQPGSRCTFQVAPSMQ